MRRVGRVVRVDDDDDDDDDIDDDPPPMTTTRTNDDATNSNTMTMPPAPSDYDELRSHYRFVLPDDDDDVNRADGHRDGVVVDGGGGNSNAATWQDRMVRKYHDHLYKEYVLADLSRVYENGTVGLRWRTADEVARGRGFRCCGNLNCPSSSGSSGSSIGAATEAAAVRRYVGIGVPENGGRVPMGMMLPATTASDVAGGMEVDDPLELYLRSCRSGGRIWRDNDEMRGGGKNNAKEEEEEEGGGGSTTTFEGRS